MDGDKSAGPQPERPRSSSSFSDGSPLMQQLQILTTPAKNTFGRLFCIQRDVVLALAGIWALNYNVLIINLALDVMEDIWDITSVEKTICTGATVAGSILGMLIFGWLGDIKGRRMMLAWALGLSALVTMASALCFGESVYWQLAFWRFALGVTGGGLFPLAAAIARESPGATVRVVTAGILMQGVGYLCAPIFTFILLQFVSDKQLLWRLMLGSGGLFFLLPLPLLLRGGLASKTQEQRNGCKANGPTGRGLMAALSHRPYWGPLVGTAGGWFLLDVTYYGNTLFEPTVLNAVFGEAQTTEALAVQEIVTYCVALPGYIAGFLLINRVGPKNMQLQGFAAMAVLYLALGIKWTWMGSHTVTLCIIYGLTFFFSNFGPNSSTFVLPALTFPAEVRMSLNGFSSASGKAGALLGTLVFPTMASEVGVGETLMFCGFVAAVAVLLTGVFVRRVRQPGGEYVGASGSVMGESDAEDSLQDFPKALMEPMLDVQHVAAEQPGRTSTPGLSPPSGMLYAHV